MSKLLVAFVFVLGVVAASAWPKLEAYLNTSKNSEYSSSSDNQLCTLYSTESSDSGKRKILIEVAKRGFKTFEAMCPFYGRSNQELCDEYSSVTGDQERRRILQEVLTRGFSAFDSMCPRPVAQAAPNHFTPPVAANSQQPVASPSPVPQIDWAARKAENDARVQNERERADQMQYEREQREAAGYASQQEQNRVNQQIAERYEQERRERNATPTNSQPSQQRSGNRVVCNTVGNTTFGNYNGVTVCK